MDRAELKKIILEILSEEVCPVKRVPLQTLACSESDRLDTGDPAHRVYTRDLFSLEESPRLGAGLMEMEETTFPWTLAYDEIDYVLSGRLTIYCGEQSVTAQPGEILLIPRGSEIRFSAGEKTRFLYVTYPADWQHAAEK